MYEGTRYAPPLHLRRVVSGPDAYNPTNGRQGKRPAVGAAHVVGKIEEFVNVTNTRCWRFLQIAERFQSSERRRSEFAQGASS